MYAVFQDGGRQFKALLDRRIRVDWRGETVACGDKLEFPEVLAISTESGVTIGQPFVTGAKVVTEVVDDFVQGDKLEVGHFRRRKNSKRKTGHRQRYTLVKVVEIVS
ncbi:MAG: 50S ribosomal protein L21 [Thermoguttaceae bacterium]